MNVESVRQIASDILAYRAERPDFLTERDFDIPRYVFQGLFEFVEEFFDDGNESYESDNFRVWKHDEEFYILYKKNGIYFSWYKHLGRGLVGNTNLKTSQLRILATMLRIELEEDGLLPSLAEIVRNLLEEMDDMKEFVYADTDSVKEDK